MPLVKKVRGGNARAISGPSKSTSDRDRGELSLPSKPNKPPTKLSDYIVFLYGDKGVGKSSLAAQFPDSITFMTEPYRKNLPIVQLPDPSKDEQPLNWDRMRRYRDLIIRSKQYQTVSIDTADRAYAHCFDYICRKANCKHPNEKKDYGQTWNDLKSEYEDFIRSFAEEKITVVATSHARNREVKTVTGEEYETVCPTAPDACWTIWKAISDYAFYYGYFQRKRVIYLRGTDAIWASCGTSEEHFLSPKGVPLGLIYVGDSPKKAYETLLASFSNKVDGIPYSDFLFEETEEDDDDEDVSLPKRKRS